MILRVMYKLIPFYVGMFLGFLTALRPENTWVYGIFGGFMLAIFIREDIKEQEEKKDGQD